MTLEILNGAGNVVRLYSSADAPERTPEELEKELIPHYWLRGTKTLSVQPGLHRWIWDLRYAAPASTAHEYPISAVPHDTPRYPLGPLVLPGQYTVRLTTNGHSLSRSAYGQDGSASENFDGGLAKAVGSRNTDGFCDG